MNDSQETREQLENRMDELARQHAQTHDPKIKAEIEALNRRLAGSDKTLHLNNGRFVRVNPYGSFAV